MFKKGSLSLFLQVFCRWETMSDFYCRIAYLVLTYHVFATGTLPQSSLQKDIYMENTSGFHWKCPSISETTAYSLILKHQCWFSIATAQDLIDSMEDWRFNSWTLLENLPVDSVITKQAFVPRAIFSKVSPTPFQFQVQLIGVWEDVLLELLDLNPSVTDEAYFVDFVAGNVVLPDSVPLAHRYGGHQFGSWSNQLGDGRAILLGEYVNQKGEHWELQLKGSGKTPYSRAADGRAVLRSSVREFLASEAMYHLGIPTSRAATLVVTSDAVYRDQFYDGSVKAEPAAVVLRIAPCWFRIGSLEILAKNGELAELKQLVDFILRRDFSEWITVKDAYTDSDYVIFFGVVVNQTADLIAQWQSVGFSHGVCNTDNFSLLSITIDYGPFGFLEQYNPDFIPNYSDDYGRYSYSKQPSIGYFNLAKLRDALILLLSDGSHSDLDPALERYWPRFTRMYNRLFRAKLGFIEDDADADQLVTLFLAILQETKSDFTGSFRQLSLLEFPSEIPTEEAWALQNAATHSKWSSFVTQYQTTLARLNISESSRVRMINATNPLYVLRNWIAQSTILAAEKEDYSELWEVQSVLENPYEEQPHAEERGFSREAPAWSRHLKVSCSS